MLKAGASSDEAAAHAQRLKSTSDLPISDEAVETAQDAYRARLASQTVDETFVAMPAAICAFLEHEGIKVEHLKRRRLIIPSIPAPSSTEGGEGS